MAKERRISKGYLDQDFIHSEFIHQFLVCEGINRQEGIYRGGGCNLSCRDHIILVVVAAVINLLHTNEIY